jgi:hypothetical protein
MKLREVFSGRRKSQTTNKIIITTKTEQVYADNKISNYFYLLFSLDIKFKNTFHKIIEHLNALYKISPYYSRRFTVHHRNIVSTEI